MTLTEFLLARIAEDEAVARQGGRWDGGMRIKWADVGGISDSLIIGTDRVLAECEAKRKIVTDRLFRESQNPDALSIFGWRILGALATPYADHPDYREEWKP